MNQVIASNIKEAIFAQRNVAQTFKSAVSQVSKPARRVSPGRVIRSDALPIWKSAIRQVWKPALRARATLLIASTNFFNSKKTQTRVSIGNAGDVNPGLNTLLAISTTPGCLQS
jgi:hypothetical protein